MFLFCGCATKSFTPVKELDCIITYNHNGTEYKGNLRSFGGGIIEIEMLSPTSFNGLKYRHDENGDSLTYLGISIPLEQMNGNLLNTVSKVLECLTTEKLQYTKTPDGYTAEGENCKLFFNANGYLSCLKYDDIVVNFSDYS